MQQIREFPDAQIVNIGAALDSFRDGGYTFEDMQGEFCDNSYQAGASEYRTDWIVESSGKNKKAISIGIADNGPGIARNFAANCLTLGTSTRLNDRRGLGKYGVGFKLSAISQGRRLTLYTKPQYLTAVQNIDDDGAITYTYEDPNTEGKIFCAFLDLEQVQKKNDLKISPAEEVEGFPKEYQHLMKDSQGKEYETGVLLVLDELDRFNEKRPYSDNIDKKFRELPYFLARTYRYIINNKEFKIFVGKNQKDPLKPYDPAFLMPNDFEETIVKAQSEEKQKFFYEKCKKLKISSEFKGELVDEGEIPIEGGYKVDWRICLTPPCVRMKASMGGFHLEGTAPFHKERGDRFFETLHIPEAEGRISFIRNGREINYAVIPRFMGSINELDRHISVEISFPAHLDEYFNVRHIKRGVEAVDHLKERLKNDIQKGIRIARKKISELFKAESQLIDSVNPGDSYQGDMPAAQDVVKEYAAYIPKGIGSVTVSPTEQAERVKVLLDKKGIVDEDAQKVFNSKLAEMPALGVYSALGGKELIEIEHFNSTVVVHLNTSHPFYKNVYLPLLRGIEAANGSSNLKSVLLNTKKGIDLLFFSYALAENSSPDPESAFGILRSHWGINMSVVSKNLDPLVTEE
ncbi:MAG: hypothetical protein EOP04_00550 [Proteobacteria bacterium]|nr:MAG: hypothetical protein EOP04_00550 [Pseudomonadota bacterium]